MHKIQGGNMHKVSQNIAQNTRKCKMQNTRKQRGKTCWRGNDAQSKSKYHTIGKI